MHQAEVQKPSHPCSYSCSLQISAAQQAFTKGNALVVDGSAVSLEAKKLKQLLSSGSKTITASGKPKFDFIRFKVYIRPPVAIPKDIDDPKLSCNYVSGHRVPLTKAMHDKKKRRMLRKMPCPVLENTQYWNRHSFGDPRKKPYLKG